MSPPVSARIWERSRTRGRRSEASFLPHRGSFPHLGDEDVEVNEVDGGDDVAVLQVFGCLVLAHDRAGVTECDLQASITDTVVIASCTLRGLRDPCAALWTHEQQCELGTVDFERGQ